MSSYPGDDGRDEGDRQHDEPTQPVGWQQPDPPRGWDAPSSSSSSAPEDSPYGRPASPSPYDQQGPYGQQYGQQYGQPYQQQYGQPYAQSPYASGPYGVPTARPDHPQATLSLVLGLVGLAGGVATCGLLLLVSPFAWVVSRRTVRAIEASGGQYGGEGSARAGLVTGIIGTVLLALGLLLVIGYVVLVVGLISSSGSEYSNV